MFITAIFTAWGLVLGAVLLFIPCVKWGWPERENQEKRLSGEDDPLALAGR